LWGRDAGSRLHPMSYAPQVFPLMVPPGFRATRRVLRSDGSSCPTNPGGYHAAGQAWPSERPILYDAFNEDRGGVPHRALDITCADGTPVVSPVDGKVKTSWVYSGRTLPGTGLSDRGGNYVWIDGDDGHEHYLAHMRGIVVRPGERVVAGQLIGLCSDTGSAKGSCPHLHYAVNDPTGAKVSPYAATKALFDRDGWQGTPIGYGGGSSWALGLAALVASGGIAYWLLRRRR